ncbi:MAG: hypothetical protein RIB67_11530 [Miltoncostaeaceae bacterium]
MSTTHTQISTQVPVALPDPRDTYAQDEEWFVARIDGRWRQIRFHDYADIYKVPGLYERLFYEILECDSPATIRAMIAEAIEEVDGPVDDLRALDLGGGNGIMGEELRALGAEVVVGSDIIPEAAMAAERDRPGVYTDYVVADMSALDDEVVTDLSQWRFNCLTCVAALGFGDIPPEAFRGAYELLEEDALVGFNINENFLDGADRSGFSEMIANAIEDGTLEIVNRRRYQHRVGTDRQPIHYIGMVGVKRGELAS